MSEQEDNRDESTLTRAMDREALERMLARYLPQLERYARRRFKAALTRRESPRDIVQSACREVLDDLSTFDDHGAGEAAFRNWLFRTTERKLRDRERHHLRQRRDIAREAGAPVSRLTGRTSATPSRAAAKGEDRQQLYVAMEKLPERYRDVIQRIHLDGETAAAVARATCRTTVAVHSLLARAMARLAQIVRAQASTTNNENRTSSDDAGPA